MKVTGFFLFGWLGSFLFVLFYFVFWCVDALGLLLSFKHLSISIINLPFKGNS